MPNPSYKQRLKALFDNEFRGEVIRGTSFPYTGPEEEYIVDSLDVSSDYEPSVLLRRYSEDRDPFPMSMSKFLVFDVTGKKVKLESIAQTPPPATEPLRTQTPIPMQEMGSDLIEEGKERQGISESDLFRLSHGLPIHGSTGGVDIGD